MSDALKNDLIDVDFVAGEQPIHIKLEGMVDQLRVAMSRVSEAVGDLFTQQTHTASGSTYSLDPLPTVGPNISRLLGSAGWMNPRHLGRIRVANREVNFHGGDMGEWQGFTAKKRRIFMLPYPPLYFNLAHPEGGSNAGTLASFPNPSYWTISAPDSGYDGSAKVATRVNDLADLNASGEYHVDRSGVITLYDGLTTSEGFKVTYTFDTCWDSYDGSRLNVIPDFAQTATLCTVALISGSTYEISLPTITHRRYYETGEPESAITYSRPSAIEKYFWIFGSRAARYTWTDSATVDNDPMYGTQATLPLALTSNLSNGDVIPAGYIQIYDETAGEILSGGEFTYVDSSTVRCIGLQLAAGSTRYRIIVPGTSVAATLSNLREAYFLHNHSGDTELYSGGWMGERISHIHLLHCTDEGDDDLTGFLPSAIGPHRNPHSQYLHRYGYQYNNSLSDPGNLHNAMLGDLVLAGNDSGTPIVSAAYDSFRLRFGTATGHYIYHDHDHPTYGSCLRMGGSGMTYIDNQLRVLGASLFSDWLTANYIYSGTDIVAVDNITAGDDITATAGHITATAGNVAAGANITAGGNITTDNDFRYGPSPATNYYVRYGVEDMVAEESSVTVSTPGPSIDIAVPEWYRQYNSGVWRMVSLDASKRLIIPIKLLTGCTITNVDALVHAASATIGVRVFRCSHNYSVAGTGSQEYLGALVSTVGTSLEIVPADVTTESRNLVSTVSYSYYVEISSGSAGDYVYGVQVTFTTPVLRPMGA